MDAPWVGQKDVPRAVNSAARSAGLTAASRGATTAVKMDVCWVE